MEDNKNITVETGETPTNSNEVYLDAIKDLKNNTVARSDYEALKAERDRLVRDIVDGRSVALEPEEPAIDVEGLKKELYGPNTNLTNLEYVKKTLTLRKEIIARGGKDPFVPHGPKYITTAADEETAERVAEVLQHCVDYANGDAVLFTNELQRCIK